MRGGPFPKGRRFQLTEGGPAGCFFKNGWRASRVGGQLERPILFGNKTAKLETGTDPRGHAVAKDYLGLFGLPIRAWWMHSRAVLSVSILRFYRKVILKSLVKLSEYCDCFRSGSVRYFPRGI